MNDKHKAALTALEAHAKSLQALVDNPNITEAELDEANRIHGEIKTLKAEVSRYTEQERLKGANADDIKWLNEPVNKIPHVGTLPTGVNVLGATRDGSLVEQEDGTMKYIAHFASRDSDIKGAYKTIVTDEYNKEWCDHVFRGRGAGSMKTISEGLDPQGGFWAPPQLLPGVVDRKPTPTRIAGRCHRIAATSDRATIASVNYRGASDDSLAQLYSTGIRATLVPEQNVGNPNTTAAAQALTDVSLTSLFGRKSIDIYTYMLSTLITKNELEDASFDPAAFIQGKFGQTIDLLKDNVAINANGANQSRGLIAAIGTDLLTQIPSINAGTGGTIVADDVVNMWTAIPEQYEENCAWAMSKTQAYATIAKIKDGNQRYQFKQGFQDYGIASARPRELEGYPMLWSGFMPNVAAGKFPLFFGDFAGVTLAERIGFSLQMQYELYSNQGMVGMLGRVRFGVEVMEPWRLRALAC